MRTLLAVFDEVDQASQAVSAIIARGLTPAAMEMIDQLTIQAVEDAFGAATRATRRRRSSSSWTGSPPAWTRRPSAWRPPAARAGAREVRLAPDEAERQLLWKGRKSAFGAYGRVSPAYMVMDGVIPRTKLP